MNRLTVSERILKMVLDAAKKHKEFTIKDLRYDVVIAKSTLNAALKRLVELGEVEVTYNGKPKRYTVKSHRRN